MKRFYEQLGRVETILAAVCFMISCLVIFFAALARSFDYPINWAQDLSLFLFAWCVFLSADAAMRADKLVSVDLLVNIFSAKWRTRITVMNYIIILLFLVALVWYGVRLSFLTRTRVFQGIPGFSYTWVTLSIPVGASFQTLTVILKLKRIFSGSSRKLINDGGTP